MGNIATTAAALIGGVTAVAGVGKKYRVEYGGTWATDDQLQLNLTATLTANTVAAGFGTVTGLQPTFAFTFDDKLNLLAGSGWYFSGTDQPTQFNDANALGTGFVEIGTTFGSADDLVAMAPYQGGVAVISRRFTQTWSVDPQPENYQRKQTLLNIGTVAKLSVQPVGDMDVYMLADNGVRSLRVRDASNNAIIADIGTPIDEIIQSVLDGLTESQRAAACAVVEPSSNRYWLYLPGNYIYVFSYFTSSGVAAWSRYFASVKRAPVSTTWTGLPASNWFIRYTGLTVGKRYRFVRGNVELSATCRVVDESFSGVFLTDSDGTFVATQTSVYVFVTQTDQPEAATCVLLELFEPEKFVVLNGRVYGRAGDKIYLYGGLNNTTYDQCCPQWDIPFLNAKSPATRKLFNGLDVICEGTWRVALGTNVADAAAVTTIYNNAGPSLMRGKSLAAKQGTHFKLRGIEMSAGYARFSSAILHYEGGDGK